ncbi:acyltransferase [Marispirochaeta aestuarii]|uniref:acyltransferase n=1 Tax=Marispirochaeta aestuarii TaxID=1963862 RepID=UPI0029C7A1B8|nr:acyltransferase [Marispirochaeta aestuarii]
MGFLSLDELNKIGFKFVGKKVAVSSRAVFYNPQKISLGDYCRIDDFCLLSAGDGEIQIGRYVHIGCYSSLIGKGPIIFEDLSGTSARVSIYSSNDDYTGKSIALPTVPKKYRKVDNGKVTICRHVVVGAGSVILPNVTLKIGVAIGALSLVNRDCDEFGVYSGVPVKRVGYRLKKMINFENDILYSDKDDLQETV